ncbi:MAG: thioredoxin family protein [Bacilli bacterium]|nr:thioredoxin family protein [Bacilli bacterium]
MNENKKMLIVIIVLGLIALIIPLISLYNSKKVEEIMNGFNEKLKSSEPTVIYVGRDTCSYCQLFEPELIDLSKLYGFGYYYVNTDDIGKADLEDIFVKLEIESESFGTPFLAVVQDGKVLDSLNGFVDEQKLFDFLQENKIIKEEAKMPLNYIDYEGYKELLASKKKEVVVFGQIGCGACEAARPILFEIAKEYDLKINYFYVSYVTEEDYDEFLSSLSYLKEKEWGTPLMLVVENNEVIDNINGAASKEFYVEFLKENGFIE